MFQSTQSGLRTLVLALSVATVVNASFVPRVQYRHNDARRDIISDLTSALGGATPDPTTSPTGAAASSTPPVSTSPPVSTTPPVSTPPISTPPATTSTPPPSTTPSQSSSFSSNTDSSTSSTSSSPVTTAPPPVSTGTYTKVITTDGIVETSTYVSTTAAPAGATAPASLPGDGNSTSQPSRTAGLVGGIVGGVGGAIVLGALAVVAWRIWGRKRRDKDEGVDSMLMTSDYRLHAAEKDAPSTAGSNNNRFQTNLESYHNPVGNVNASSNF